MIGFIHIVQVLFITFYPFIISKNFLGDFLYLCFIICINILWCYFGTCPITYYFYKYKKESDIDFFINTKSNLYLLLTTILEIITLLSIYIVSIRSNLINVAALYILLITKEYYSLFIKKDGLLFKYQNNKVMRFFHFYFVKFCFAFNILLLIYMFYKNKNRLIK